MDGIRGRDGGRGVGCCASSAGVVPGVAFANAAVSSSSSSSRLKLLRRYIIERGDVLFRTSLRLLEFGRGREKPDRKALSLGGSGHGCVFALQL